jgi:hypothetical protein
MAEDPSPSENLPTVSKQTAGGITGAVAGGVIGGPVGAVIGGVAGAVVGQSSAKGKKPIKKMIDAVRARLGRAKKKASQGKAKASPTSTKKKDMAPTRNVAKKTAKAKGRKPASGSKRADAVTKKRRRKRR